METGLVTAPFGRGNIYLYTADAETHSHTAQRVGLHSHK